MRLLIEHIHRAGKKIHEYIKKKEKQRIIIRLSTGKLFKNKSDLFLLNLTFTLTSACTCKNTLSVNFLSSHWDLRARSLHVSCLSPE